MTILAEHEIKYLTDILNSPIYDDNREWLEAFLKDQPITNYRAQIALLTFDYNELATRYEALKRDYELARAGIESLKHLQKYEGMQKHESELLGLQQENRILREEIERLRRG